jgi:C-terminal processing protease CtpA/Prc
MTPELREHFGAPQDRGVLVERVEDERPAAKAGVRVGDIVLAVDEKAVESPHDLVSAVRRAPDGATLRLEILRGGEKRSIAVRPEPRDEWTKEADEWMERFERGFEEGGRHLERRLDDLERRFEELQRRFEERLRELEDKPVGT